MTAFNKVIVMGNLTNDPTSSEIGAKTIAKFGIAVNEKYKVDGELKESVGYFDIVVWGKQANSCNEFLRKGSLVLIEGKLRQSRWEDKEAHQKRSKIEIVASSVTFMPKKNATPDVPYVGDGIPFDTKAAFPESEVVDSDMIPF